jgi:hypothetical protein
MMDLEARRAELEQLVAEKFLGSPEAWVEGWDLLVSLYEEGEVYAATMAGRILARNRPANTAPPAGIKVFLQTFAADKAIEHEEKKHTFVSDGFCTDKYGCGATVAGSKNISEQDRMVHEARERLRNEENAADKRDLGGNRPRSLAPTAGKAVDEENPA